MLLQLGSDGRPVACGGEEKGDDEDLEGRPASFLGRKAGADEEKSSSHSKPPPAEILEGFRVRLQTECRETTPLVALT